MSVCQAELYRGVKNVSHSEKLMNKELKALLGSGFKEIGCRGAAAF